MDAEEARASFAAARVARLATVDATGTPHLVPVVFAVLESTLVFAVDEKPKTTRRLRRLRNIEADPRVSLLVDHYDEDWDRLWWVRVDGSGAVLDSQASESAIDGLVDKYPQYRRTRPRGPAVEVGELRWQWWSAQS